MIPQELLLFGMGALLTIAASIFTYWVIRSGARSRPAQRPDVDELPQKYMGSSSPSDAGLPLFSRDVHVMPEQIIRRGLEDLLRRDPESAFTIFEQRGGSAYVQFVLTPDGLVLDFPLAELNREQSDRAIAFFAEQGISVEQYRDRRNVAQMSIYRQPFGRDIGLATAVALRLFERIFGLPDDFSLYVKTE